MINWRIPLKCHNSKRIYAKSQIKSLHITRAICIDYAAAFAVFVVVVVAVFYDGVMTKNSSN